MSEPGRPARVRVTGPPRRRASGVRPSASREIDADTELGAVYMSSLLGEQLRLAAGVLVALGLTVGVLPLVFHLFPHLSEVRVAGVPVPWLLLGVLPATGSAAPSVKAAVERTMRLLDMLGLDPAEVSDRLVLTPACGLAGATPAYARAVLAALRGAAEALT